MKLAFSTLGCPGWSWEEIFSAAVDLGFDGIEVRGLENEMFAPEVSIFRPENVEKTLSDLSARNIEIPMLTSGADLSDWINRGRFISEGKSYIDLAARVGAPYIRVLGDLEPAPKNFVDVSLVTASYTDLCDYAAQSGVKVLMETNGVFAETKVLKKLMQEVNHPNSGVLWDLHHPWRFFGEEPELSFENIGEYVKHVHVKDSIKVNGKVSYRMLGAGEMPVEKMISVLKSGGYEGYFSLEWVKRWEPDLEDAGVVFAHYVNRMRSYL